MRLEIVERLETILTAILRLAGGRPVTRLLKRANRMTARTRHARRLWHLGATAMQRARIDPVRLDRSRGTGPWRRDTVSGEPLTRIGRNPVGRPSRRQAGLDAETRNACGDQRASDVARNHFGGGASGIGRCHRDKELVPAPLDASNDAEIDHRDHWNLR